VICPACQTKLVVVEREGIELDWCLECRGLWFDAGELELLAERSGRRLETDDVGRPGARPGAGKPRRCPRCRRRMRPALAGRSEPVTIDRCADHGLWFDRGELGSLMRQLGPGAAIDESVILSFLGETFRASGSSIDPSPTPDNGRGDAS